MSRQQQLLLAGSLLSLGLAAWLLFGTTPRNMSYFLTPTEVGAGKAATQVTVRVGGTVKAGSLRPASPAAPASLVLSDGGGELAVRLRGPLPALLREGSEAVAEGRIENGVLMADSIIPRFDDPLKKPVDG
jgi:cytochrome c-type biogenesis protein CcmE